jgi:hypothetical protein
LVTPGTILRWHRRLVATTVADGGPGSRQRDKREVAT